MGYNRAQLKESVKQSMRMTASKPMLVTLVFSVVVSAGSGLLNGILGRLFSAGTGDITNLFLAYLRMGYDVETAVEAVLDRFIVAGPPILFGAMFGGAIVSFIVSLWSSTMNVGYEGYCLAMVRSENPPLEKIFCAFPQIGSVLATRLLTGLFEFLWSLLLVVAYIAALMVLALVLSVLEEVGLALYMLMILPLTVALVLGIICITLRYALVDYALLDRGMGGMDAIRESKRLMRGRTAKAFGLQMSFFGWYLLQAVIVYAAVFVVMGFLIGGLAAMPSSLSEGGLIAGAGFALLVVLAAVAGTVILTLWLRPYVTGSMAKFYEWAKADASGGMINMYGGPGYGGGYGGYGGGPGGYGGGSGGQSGGYTGPSGYGGYGGTGGQNGGYTGPSGYGGYGGSGGQNGGAGDSQGGPGGWK